VKGCELDLDSTGAGVVQQGEGWTLNIVTILWTLNIVTILWTLNIVMILCVSYVNSAEFVGHLSDRQLLKDSAAWSS
jgi:hypothetical protein